MGNLVRTVGISDSNRTQVKRTVGVLNDGSVVMMVVDMNQTGVPGDGGDETGIPKIHIYHSANRTNWTLKATLNTPGVMAQALVASMCVDSANNIHVTYRWTPSSIRYNKLTFAAGPVWTPGTDQVVAAAGPSGYNSLSLLDIDTLGDSVNAVVISSYVYNTVAGAKKTAVASYVRTTGGVWVAHAIDVMMGSASHLGYADDLTVSGDNKTAIGGDNVAVFAYNCVRKADNGTDYGDVLQLVRVNVSTGARVAIHTIKAGHYAGAGGGFRKFWLFNNASNEFILAGVVNTSPMQCGLYKFSWNRTTNTATSLVVATTSGSQGTNISKGSFNHHWAAAAYAGSDRVLFFGINNGAAVCAVGEVVTNVVNGNTVRSVGFSPGWTYWDSGYGSSSGYYNNSGQFQSPSVSPTSQIWSGATRNQTSSRIDVMAFHNKPASGAGSAVPGPLTYRVESRSILLPLPPGGIIPAASSTQTTDRPSLSADHKLQMYWPQLPTKMVWYIASDAGFTTNLRQIDEPSEDFRYPVGTSSPYNKKVTSTEALPGIYELTQGTWYVRALTTDYVGNAGSWSPSNVFTVTHPPVPADLYPTGGAVFLYAGAGSVTFTWRFTDPSPYDSQTAYRIVVENDSDGSVLVDSGKVSASAQSATLNIPVGGKDVNLRWKLTLWDSDDVSGPESGPQLFYATDPPAPVISSPANGAVLSTATPQVGWSPGIGGSKEQSAYRVTVTQGSALIYNSEWQISSDTSHNLPVGHLVNDQQYTITVEVRDNLNLTGSASVSVSTDWVEPMGPDTSAWSVYTHDFDKRGYVYITWTNTYMDSDFAAWIVYRRKVGEGAWSRIASYTSGTDRYAHRDYLAAAGESYEYTITQMVDRFGDLVESVITKVVQVSVDSDNYWIVDLVQPEKSIPLYNVTSDNFKEEYEQETYTVIGRGRHVDYGERLGYAGSLSAQLRDKLMTGMARTNYLLNPAMSYQSVSGATPDGWSVVLAGSTGEVTQGYVEAINPSPTGKTPYRLQAIGMGGAVADSIRFEQKLDASNNMPLALAAPGATVTFTTWVAVGSNVGKNYRLSIEWLGTSGTTIIQNDGPLISDRTTAAVETYIPATSPDVARGNAYPGWYRFQLQATVPSGTPVGGLRVKIWMIGDGSFGSGSAELIASGAQLEVGSRSPYIDGDQLGVEWAGAPYLSSSITTGYYTARQQRKALEEIKSRKSKVYLRNPFGDIWLVAPGDVDITRIPGVGKAEFVDVQIPYQEVSF